MSWDDYDWYYLRAYGMPDRLKKVLSLFGEEFKNTQNIEEGYISGVVSRVTQEPNTSEYEELAKVLGIKIRYQYLSLPAEIWDYSHCEYNEALADEYIKRKRVLQH